MKTVLNHVGFADLPMVCILAMLEWNCMPQVDRPYKAM